MQKGRALGYGFLLRGVSNENNKQYIIQEAWPDNIFLQCGAEGIVVGLKSGTTRKTAFFEAFPFTKFIRADVPHS